MKLLNLNIGIKIDNTSKVLDLVKKVDAEICTFQEAMNALSEDCFDMYKSKNELVLCSGYSNSFFAPLYVADCITDNGEVIRDFGGLAEQGSLILSRYEILKSSNEFYYNEYRDNYDATNFKEDDWCRSIQNVLLDVGGKELQIINVHGIWNKGKIGDLRTLAQSEFILSRIRKDIPVIVVGDFNLLPDTDSIKLLDEQLINLIKKYNIKSTRPKFNDDLDKGNMVCDYVFINDKVKVNDFMVLDNADSDHLPIILDFEI